LGICPHYRRHAESWPGGFYRDDERDRRIIEENPVSPDTIKLDDLRIAGQSVAYRGRHAVVWRYDGNGALLAFAGLGCVGIQLNGYEFAWSEQPVDIAWHPLGSAYQTPGYLPLYRVWCGSPGVVRVPLPLDCTWDATGNLDEADIEVWLGAYKPADVRQETGTHLRVGYGAHQIPSVFADGSLVLDVDARICDHWLYVVRRRG
jgi:hypothetical protein